MGTWLRTAKEHCGVLTVLLGLIVLMIVMHFKIQADIDYEKACMQETVSKHKSFLEAVCGTNIAQADEWDLINLCHERAHSMHHPIDTRATKEVLDSYGFPGWVTWAIFYYVLYILLALFLFFMFTLAYNYSQKERRERVDLFTRVPATKKSR